MIPKYPFQVHHTYRLGLGRQATNIRNFETLLPAAIAAGEFLRQPNTVRVQLLTVLSDSKPDHDDHH